MGHLVEQAEVAAIETRVSKVTTAPPTPTISSQQQQQGQQQLQQQQQQQQQQLQQQGQQQLQQQQQRQQTLAQPNHKQRGEEVIGEKGEGGGEAEVSGCEEEWWAERVVGALGGVGGQYGDTWYRSHAHLLQGDGPLPHTWRLYIAALAVCRHEVGWLMRALVSDFTSAGGDLRWLTGLHRAPPKLVALASINNILAHRPWLLLPLHIQQLTKGEESWSLGELCQALCIMTHFHALSSFLHGCGLSTLPRKVKKQEGGEAERELASISQRDAGCPQIRPTRSDSSRTSPSNANHPCTARSDGKNKIVPESAGGTRLFSHLTINPKYNYEDFNGNDQSRMPSFSVHEYNWQDHGYAMCSRLLGEVGAFLDDRFTAALSTPTLSSPAPSPLHTFSPSSTHPLSSPSSHPHSSSSSLSSLSSSSPAHPPSIPQQEAAGSVDHQANQVTEATQDKAQNKSAPVPTKALWNYVQWLLGIHHDDYDYTQLSKLDPQVKDFVKTTCCFPESLADPASRPGTATPAQMETSVVVMEARLQSELLYALRAIMLHQC